ncbi:MULTISPECIES: type II TA system antitoxin MqsA family protein [unclassified Thermosipho (in: thermotogales)]|uniref:type II TA system antitoxin MqsA family protein n=1 Tax=unclassified Thermosipho (in: thermotogales) TaxID=2676525 RepID=UPI0018CC75CC|nr:type II TA system antitoxin MqsA family protein [Thermosipho sp. 1223]MBT1247335.1 hypothetical protein [Thermosipho sp. 1244]
MIKIVSPTKKLYCEKCDDLVDYKIKTKKEEHNIRGDKIEIEARIAICKICGNELFEPYLENENLKALYRKYVRKHGLVLPEEIKKIREKYGLSQELFAKILGIGKATIERYERGSLPTKSISNLIKSVSNPENFLMILKSRKDKLNISKNEYEKVIYTLEKLLQVQLDNNADKTLEKLEKEFQKRNSSMNINFKKLYAVSGMILYFLNKLGIKFVSKTKFLKLIWFVESGYWDKYNAPLTGLAFARLRMGPVPNYYEDFIELLIYANVIGCEDKIVKNPSYDSDIITLLYLKKLSYEEYLDSDEKEFIKAIIEKYGQMKTSELIDLTHKDKRWMVGLPNSIIRLST